MIYNPWRGCKRYSEGCLHCYIHSGDLKRKVDTANIVKTKDFYKPILKNKDGSYKMKSGLVYLCFSSDFFLEEADIWRDEVWQMIKERSDCKFLFLTKRIERINSCLPKDINDGYDNVIIYATCENQRTIDIRLRYLKEAPFLHKGIVLQPLLEKVNIENYLDENIQEVLVGGEENKDARVLDYDWVLDIRDQCLRKNVNFTFRQLGTNFLKDGKLYHLKRKDLMSQARKANIDIKNRKHI